MKRILILLALLTATASAQTPVCKIYGTVDSVAGPLPTFPAAKGSITVTRAQRPGSLFSNTSRIIPINPDGTFSFYAPRTSGTDTAVIHVMASFGNLASGQYLYVPDADSAELRTLVRYTANPTFVVVAVPTSANDSTQTIFDPSGTQKIPASRLDVGAITGDTTGTTNQPMQGRFENMLGQFTAGTSDSLQQVAANVFVARNVAEGKADADSVKIAFDRLGDRADADSLAGVKTTADGAVQKADTNALHAQKFALINDSLFAISLRATSTANDLTAHASTADAHLPSQTGASGKFLQSNGTVSSWQTALTAETDPTYTAAAAGLALKSDTANSVRITHPTIPGLASADTNTVIGVDASGNLVLRKDDAGGGAALTNWEDPDTSATQASRTLKPKAFTANVNAVIRPLGTGAFILGPPPDGTATGGNARGAYAVDLQRQRGNANHITAGQSSFAVGENNASSGLQSAAIGYNNIASGHRSGAIGAFIRAETDYSFAAGMYDTTSGDYGIALGRASVVRASKQQYSGSNQLGYEANGIALGTQALSYHRGAMALASGAFGGMAGTAQTYFVGLFDTTGNAVTDTLTLNNSEGVPKAWSLGGRVLIIDSGFVWTYSALVSARSDAGDAASFKVEGCIKRVGATTSMVGTPTITTLAADATAATWAVTAVADDTNDALHILVTGAANKLIRWHAAVTISIVGF